MEDITASLPRDPAGFKQRTPNAIRYLVINHTGGSPTVPVEKIAEFHRQRGYPGIAYHFLVDGQGAIFQVNPITETVSDQGYLGEGVNIAIAGKFDDAVPTDAQLDAAARLSAWLLQELRLPPEAIKGVSEFVATGSPGWQWLRGQRYKDRLLKKVAEVQPAPVEPAPTPPADSAELARLQAEVASLRSQLAEREAQLSQLRAEATRLQGEVQTRDQRIAALTSQVTRIQGEVARLQRDVQARDQRIADLTEQAGRLSQQAAAQQAEIVRLQEALARQGAGSGRTVVQPAIFDVVDALPKHPTLRYSQRQRSQITHIAIHHSATPANIAIERVAQYHISADPSRNKEPWPGIGYHFYVKPDGAIYLTNRLETVAYHVYANNERAIGICVSGDFTRAAPTVEQINSTAHLVAWLMQELNIPEQNVLGHREFPQNDTTCPGAQWLEGRQWRTTLLETVRAFRSGRGPGVWPKTITHYVLFWQRPDAWAREDWLSAEKYIGRFRPTAGFSLDDARNAEFVTIVGGEAGVSREAEQMLRAAGCKVERLAGVDYADTKRMLDTLADTGRRFQSFAVGEGLDV
ncbi:MAG: N-acetylmuramoyl-L-alanine amidase [Caldilineales bacterium]|nr:N-acetylmuramoyl-L-alanine amidase [Caldilineales bacterium]